MSTTIRVEFVPKDGPQKLAQAFRAIAGREFFSDVLPLSLLRELAVKLVREEYPHKGGEVDEIEGTSRDYTITSHRAKNFGRGFQAYPFGTAQGNVGFHVRHESNDPVINKILTIKEFGADATIIRARNASVLRFVGVDPETGEKVPVYRQSVFQPAQPAHHYIEKARERFAGYVEGFIQGDVPRRMTTLLRKYGVK